jgi:methylenetetrahydrofolate dehydrogenase (NADP+)/methenyltetrahydrofolate cyclohydrolase
MRIIDGKLCAQQVKDQIAKEVAEISAQGQRPPRLDIFLVGDRPDSLSYVNSKYKTCKSLGMECVQHLLPETTTESELMVMIDECNRNEEVDAILIQLPLPDHYNSARVLEFIDYRKDADGLHLMNVGLLHLGEPYVMPCTPKGIITLLETNNIEVAGEHVVMIGRSQLVGEPTAKLLIHSNATVTLCHSRTKNLAEIAHIGDIVITAAGCPNLLHPYDFKEGAVLIDVAMNRVNGKLQGDVYSEETRPELEKRLRACTPVPGGVGPMTICSLMKNTLSAAKKEFYPD